MNANKLINMLEQKQLFDANDNTCFLKLSMAERDQVLDYLASTRTHVTSKELPTKKDAGRSGHVLARGLHDDDWYYIELSFVLRFPEIYQIWTQLPEVTP